MISLLIFSLSFACSMHGHRETFSLLSRRVNRDCLSHHQYYGRRHRLMDIHLLLSGHFCQNTVPHAAWSIEGSTEVFCSVLTGVVCVPLISPLPEIIAIIIILCSVIDINSAFVLKNRPIHVFKLHGTFHNR